NESGNRDKSIRLRACLWFLVAPCIMLLLTFCYNYLRFSSCLDFGNARIPGVLEEPWYHRGIFSLSAVPLNFHQMLTQGWKYIGHWPYFVPTGFGGSILLSSPFLLLMLRGRSRDTKKTTASWLGIALLTSVLWVHGNPGGWQFSYRYAIELLPWIYIILLYTRPLRMTVMETILLFISIAINCDATYLFYWTAHVK